MAAADLNTIRATIETHFIAGFGADITEQDGDILTSQGGLIIVTESPETDSTPLVFNNLSYVPAANDSFVQCLVSFASSSYLSLGSTTDSINRIDGTIVANIFTPQNAGPGANYDLASRVCTLYTRHIIDGIQFEAISGPGVVTAPQPSSFFQTTVTVPFNVFEAL